MTQEDATPCFGPQDTCEGAGTTLAAARPCWDSVGPHWAVRCALDVHVVGADVRARVLSLCCCNRKSGTGHMAEVYFTQFWRLQVQGKTAPLSSGETPTDGDTRVTL